MKYGKRETGMSMKKAREAWQQMTKEEKKKWHDKCNEHNAALHACQEMARTSCSANLEDEETQQGEDEETQQWAV